MSAASLTLYAIEDNLVTLFDTLEGMAPDDPLREELEALAAQAIALEVKKVDGLCRILAHFENQVAFAAAEVKRLNQRKQRFEREIERLETAAISAMEMSNQTKLEGKTSRLKLQANPPSVLILDEDLIPAGYKTYVPESWTVSKAAIAKDLKRGVAVPGADLSEGNMRLVWS